MRSRDHRNVYISLFAVMKLIITRLSKDDTQTIGEILAIGSGKIERFASLELAWKDNERRISSVPCGKYKANREVHPRFGNAIRIHNVPNREGILMHVGNHHHQILGCILPGMGFNDIDKDGHVDVVQSRVAMNRIYDLVGDDPINVEIIDISL